MISGIYGRGSVPPARMESCFVNGDAGLRCRVAATFRRHRGHVTNASRAERFPGPGWWTLLTIPAIHVMRVYSSPATAKSTLGTVATR